MFKLLLLSVNESKMLRVKRSVEASFSTVNYNAAEMSGTSNQVENLSNDEAMKMIAEREGVELDQQPKPLSGFVASKRTAEAAQLGDVEERVAKLRKATAATTTNTASQEEQDDDDDEIDIDALLGEEGDDENEPDEENTAEPTKSAQNSSAKDVSTKAVPAAVFGGLAKLADSDK